jgi:hypothetical protein
MSGISEHLRYVVHGLPTQLACHVPSIEQELERALGAFRVSQWPDGCSPAMAAIRRFEQTDVLRHLSTSAAPLTVAGQMLELFQDNERFWLVDERWGLCQMNLLRGHWRSWILPWPTADAAQVVEMAVLWPLAQVLRFRGLHLVPAISVARGDWGVLIVTPMDLEPELGALIDAGYQVIGQRWTALREEGGRISLLSMPGYVQRMLSVRPGGRSAPVQRRVDLHEEHPPCRRNHAFCESILITAPGRRANARIFELADTEAATALRRDWPIAELHPQRHHGQLATLLVQRCRCSEVQLSRYPHDFVRLVESIRPMASVFMPHSTTVQRPQTRPAVAV